MSNPSIPLGAAAVRAVRGSTIAVADVGKAYIGNPQVDEDWAIRHVSFEVAAGEFFILLGPSGCGKSTLLRLLAGITPATEGQILAGDRPVTGPGPERGMVFQAIDTPLFDWLTAEQNVEFGLRMAGLGRRDRAERGALFLKMVGLAGHEHKFPHEMSGGMKQRLQIARALATEPVVLLMDEPFASVDAQTRRILQSEVQRIWLETRRTVIYVTHDIREALILGQRIAVMSSGPASSIAHIYEQDMDYPRDDLDPTFNERFRVIEAHIAAEVAKGWGETAT